MRRFILLFSLIGIIYTAKAEYSFTGTSIVLTLDQNLLLQNGQYNLILQNDSNLVLYQWNVARWSSNTANSGATKLIMQNDGNLVLYTAGNTPIWSTGTGGNPNAIFRFQDDGNLVVYNNANTAIWSNNTGASSLFSPYVNHNISGIQMNTSIINTLYPTEDTVLADYNVVTDFGADNTGLIDATSIIQQALNNCFNNGGGTVWLPAGRYRITSAINIPQSCCLRGDWQDPDTFNTATSTCNSYGTIILVDIRAGLTNNNVFIINNSAGVMGLTIYYPHQNPHRLVPYDYTISCEGANASTVKNVTFINAYRGIKTPTSYPHELYTFQNIRGTCLNIGLYASNGSDVSVWEDIRISNKYWADAPACFNPPSMVTLNTQTKDSGTGLLLADIEWDQFLRISILGYKYGIRTITGPRIRFQGIFTDCIIDNCETAVQLEDYDTRWGPSFVNCTLKGDLYSVRNLVAYVNTASITLNHCTVLGQISGANISISNNPSATPNTSSNTDPTSVPRSSRRVLYNVASSPYNCPRVKGNYDGSLPTLDASPAIQSALNQAANDGGGIVYLPGGWYRINGNLSVPANVELRGVSALPNRDTGDSIAGSTLFIASGHNNSNATATITLGGNNSGVSGIKFFHPGRNYNYGNYPYPFVIRGNGNFNFVRNISIQNAYYGVDFETNSCNNFYIERLQGMCSLGFLHVGGSGNISGTIKNILSNPNYALRVPYKVHNWPDEGMHLFSNIINPITRVYEYLVVVKQNGVLGSSSIVVSNAFGYGVHHGILNEKSGTTIFNIGTDNLGSGGYSIVAWQPITVVNLLRYNGAGSTLGYAPSGAIVIYTDKTL